MKRDIDDNDNVSIVNMFTSSLFKDINVQVHNQPLSDLSSSHANVKAYWETCLTYGMDPLKTHLASGLYVPDTPYQYDSFGIKKRFTKPTAAEVSEDLDGNVNYGYHARKKFIAKSRQFDFMIPLSHDFIQTDRLIAPGPEVQIQLIRASDAYSLLSPDDNPSFSVKFVDLKLFIRLVKVSPKVREYHKSMFLRQPAIPYQQDCNEKLQYTYRFYKC